MRLAVILPSRGLIYSQTIDEVLREIRSIGCEWDIFFAHSRPIPECFNEPIQKAMDAGFTHFWMVEEDMVLPEGILQELIDSGVPIAAADYPVSDKSMCVTRDRNGLVKNTGTGCLFAEREAFASVLPFTTKYVYEVDWSDRDKWKVMEIPELLAESMYGLHDIHFGMTLYNRGTPIHVIDTLCTQRRVSRPAVEKQNVLGWHDIEELPIPTSFKE